MPDTAPSALLTLTQEYPPLPCCACLTDRETEAQSHLPELPTAIESLNVRARVQTQQIWLQGLFYLPRPVERELFEIT